MTSREGARYVGPYSVLHSRPVYENPWIKVREDRVRPRGGEEMTFGVVTMKPGITVLPMDEAGDVYLVREFKYGIGEETLEAISGAIDSGETPEQAGLRELSEEAGLMASEWIDMGSINPFTTVVNSPNHMFLARKLSETRRRPDAGERVEIVKLPFSDALQAVLEGTITHGASCVLILKTHLYLSRSSRR
jgi:8-oxo-dGTP pyrophosphatase MutT (NUDIX family)